ncbi:MAG TPA: cytochrome c3 family protein [Vicinamibacterales bacterium]|jgi:predicted CXXCH cytochrome family protein|nr:cytochrome c3 family protein [Vicinamibacterales bacterium]
MKSQTLFGWGGTGLCLLLFIGAWQSADAAQAPLRSQPIAIQLPSQPADQGFVGSDRCRACHRAEVTEFHKTPHANVTANGQRMDCESCHGAGKPHADAEEAARGEDAATAAANKLIFAFRGSPQQNAARCLSCHVTARTQQDFAHSQHIAVGVACQACHSTHLVEAADPRALRASRTPQAEFFVPPRPDEEARWLRESLVKARQPDVCYSCHAKVRGQFAQAFHHRVPEGSMKCTDCHSTHSSNNRSALNQPGWETCTTCHADKHGPFVFEHAAVKVEGCAVCHTPHGATARFLLVRRESRFLCLQCHGDPHSAQEQASVPHSRFGFQTRGDCTRCHVAIHGSNFDPAFLK